MHESRWKEDISDRAAGPHESWGQVLGTGAMQALRRLSVVACRSGLARPGDAAGGELSRAPLKGDSYRLRDRDLGGRRPAPAPETA